MLRARSAYNETQNARSAVNPELFSMIAALFALGTSRAVAECLVARREKRFDERKDRASGDKAKESAEPSTRFDRAIKTSPKGVCDDYSLPRVINGRICAVRGRKSCCCHGVIP